MKSPGVSGLGLMVAATGGLLVVAGVRDVSIVDALRQLAGGVSPRGAGPKVTQVSFSGVGYDDDHHQAAGDTGGSAAAGSGGIAEAAARYIGVPYRWGGKDPATGLDCSGLVYRAILDATGAKAPLGSYGQSLWRGFDRVSRDQVAAGDVCWWPGHVVVAVSNTRCISAPRPGLAVREESIDTAGPAGTGKPTLCLRYNGHGATTKAQAPKPKPDEYLVA